MSIIHVMTCKRYTKTQDMTHPDTYNQSDSADACTCGGLTCSTKLIVTVFHPPHIRLALKVFQASSYSQHSSQYALCETN